MTPGDEPRAETRILIADDHDSFRSGLRAVLGTADDLLVVGEAASGSEAVSQVAALHPDVVLMDLTMPCMDGIEATRRIVDAAPACRGARADDVRRRRLGLRRDPGRRARLPPQGRPARRAHPLGARRRGGRRHLRSGRGATADGLLLTTHAERFPCRIPRAHRPGAGDPRAGGAGAVERRYHRDTWCFRRRPCATMSRTSSRSSRSATAPRRSSAPARPAWAGRMRRRKGLPFGATLEIVPAKRKHRSVAGRSLESRPPRLGTRNRTPVP